MMGKKSPNLETCTVEEWADWYCQEVKANGGFVSFPTGVYNMTHLHKLTEAFRIVGQREGYKKGKKDGSGSTFNHFFRSEVPCEICRHYEICNHEHRTKCDVWLRWLGVK